MDKRLIFSVAGSGKTTKIVNSLSLERRSLIITYTENNAINLKQKIIKNFGYSPENIKVLTYFNFIYSFCYKPFCAIEIKAKGMNWKTPPVSTNNIPRDNIYFYLDSNKRLYHNRLAKFLQQFKIVPLVIQRIEKYFDELYFDEVQDFASHDFNLLIDLMEANLKILLVGDFFQHTFDTSRDGNVNKSLHTDYKKYKKRFKMAGVILDEGTLSLSYRCSPTVCSFIENKLLINISSHREDTVRVELLTDEKEILRKIYCSKTVKLFYQKHKTYGLFSENWGSSKGLDDFQDVCVILNKTTFENYSENNLSNLAAKTKNKLYVACTRARGNLFFIEEKIFKKILNSSS